MAANDSTWELLIDGAWTSITGYTRVVEGAGVRRGRPNEASTTDPGQMQTTVNNTDGRFSPRYPTGAWYGKIGRNTPIRHYVNAGTTRMTIGADADFASCPDTVATSVTGDLDVRFDGYRRNWKAGGGLAGKFLETGNQRSWALYNANGGFPTLYTSADGLNASVYVCAAPLPVTTGRIAIRATIDVDNGASGRTVTFYTADTLNGSWTQLGQPIVRAGVTSIFNSTSPTYAGNTSSIAAGMGAGSAMYGLQVRSGIGGTVVAQPDFTAQTNGATSFSDGFSNTWTTTGAAAITNRRFRFYGEVSSFPIKRDDANRDITVPFEASGILRRLNSSATALNSVMYRALAVAATDVVAYWPCEDGSNATYLASGLTIGAPMRTGGAIPYYAGYSGFAASDPIPIMNQSAWSGAVPSYAPTGAVQFRWLQNIPATFTTDEALLGRIGFSGTAARWDVYHKTGGHLRIAVFDSDGTQIATTATILFGLTGLNTRVGLELTQSGSDIAWGFYSLEVGKISGVGTSGTITGRTIGVATQVKFGSHRNLTDVAIGHVSVQSAVTSLYDLGSQITGYNGEAAGRRIERLCAENSVPFTGFGSLDATELMGPQKRGALVDVINDCVTADMGILLETRTQAGLGYRTRESLYNQNPVATISYTGGDIIQMDPTDDDQNTINDVTVNRVDGSGYRAVQATGPLSTQAPPLGVGTYDTQVSVNVQSDAQCQYNAGWRLRIGTTDVQRFPNVLIHLQSPNYKASAAQTSAILDVNVGDLITVTNPPTFQAPGSVSMLVQAIDEETDEFGRRIVFTCTPGDTWRVGVYDTPASRYSTNYSYLSVGGYSSTATGFYVTTPTGPMWTTSAGDFPFDCEIAGEVVTVTNVVPFSANTQIFTVTRSVNGVVKGQLINTEIRLAKPAYYAL